MDISFFSSFCKEYNIKLSKPLRYAFTNQFLKEPSLKTVSILLQRLDLQHLIIEIPSSQINQVAKPFIFFKPNGLPEQIREKEDITEVLIKHGFDINAHVCFITCIAFEDTKRLNLGVKRKVLQQAAYYLLGFLVVLGLFYIHQHLQLFYFLSSLAALALSLFLSLYSMGLYQTPFCNISNQINCSELTASKWGKLKHVPIIFFAIPIFSTQFILSFSPGYEMVLCLLSCLSFPFALFYSLLMIRLKHLCLYCLSTHIVVSIMFIYSIQHFSWQLYSYPMAISVALLSSLVSLLYFLFLKNLRAKLELQLLIIESQLNYDVLNEYESKTDVVLRSVRALEISNSSDISVEVFCFFNLTCSKCQESLDGIYQLIQDNQQVKVNLIYSGPSSSIGYYKFGKLLDQHKYSVEGFKRAFYQSKTQNVSPTGKDYLISELEEHLAIGRQLNIVKTPSFFVKGVTLPAFYPIEDLRYAF